MVNILFQLFVAILVVTELGREVLNSTNRGVSDQDVTLRGLYRVAIGKFVLTGFHIHLIPKWRPVYYSSVCMLIRPLCLASMLKGGKEG